MQKTRPCLAFRAAFPDRRRTAVQKTGRVGAEPCQEACRASQTDPPPRSGAHLRAWSMAANRAAGDSPWENRRQSETDTRAAQTTAGWSNAACRISLKCGAEEENIRRPRLRPARTREPTARARWDLSTWNPEDP